MTGHRDADKWNRMYACNTHRELKAARVLLENTHLLPASGKALDAACGSGANALVLAQQGLETCAWDISQTAIDRLQQRATDKHLALQAQTRDIIAAPPAAATFDIIVVSHFLDRALIPRLIQALRNNGLIFYQTFIREAGGDGGPHNPRYRLERNELLYLFRTLQLLVYREEGRVGNLQRGMRNEAMLIAQQA